jgi:DNA polymerase (family 10)
MHKNLSNLELAELLRAVAAAYQVQNKANNRFKIIAYQRAADAIEHLSSEAKDLYDDNKLDGVAGIGKGISSHIGEIFETGNSKHFEKLFSNMPSGMFELIKVPGIGPKTAYKLASEFKLDKKRPLDSVKKLIAQNKISKLEGFGDESQEEIMRGIRDFENKPDARMILPRAQEISDELISYLKENKNVLEADPLGSLRRKASTIGDIDISVATKNGKEIINYFCKYPKKRRIIERGDKSASILLPGEIRVDLKVSDPSKYGSLLQHFTGSKHHNIALREYALKKGLSLSEYGIKKINSKAKRLNKFTSEEKFYNYLGLSYIEPELREDSGEIQASHDNKLPKLVDLGDVKGDLQIHSSFDIETSHDLGENSMEEIIERAGELNYEYLAFTEHNPSKSKHSQKQMIELLKRKQEKIDKINYSLRDNNKNGVKKVFNSLEIDILPDGSLPVKSDGLDTLDFALVSIHSSFDLDRQKMTTRVISALNHPKVKIFAHPTARKINHREGVELNWDNVFEFCLKHNKWIEINADPMRLDLPDFLVKDAIDRGLKLTFGTDAHNLAGLDNMKWAVCVARRGWASKYDIVNTRTYKQLQEMLK